MAANGETIPIDFCTLGMFIIDDIYPSPSSSNFESPKYNIIGGAGTYSAIGARLFSPPPTSKSVGWIVDAGTDFPPELHSVITSWNTGLLLRPRDALTTRGWNGYGESDHRAFKYLTEKKRLTANDLATNLLEARSFHLICSPTRCIDMVDRILERRRKELGPDHRRPIMIWEPVPDLCTPSELQNTYAALQKVDICSPNHEELASLFSFTHPASQGVDKAAVERQSNQLLARGIGPTNDGTVVLRAGKDGCYIACLNKRQWLPAYYQDASKVIDPTGGGNGFLGGLAAGLVRKDGDVVEAAKWGSVAASFCIQQTGVPDLSPSTDNVPERWNGVDVFKRLEEFQGRISAKGAA